MKNITLKEYKQYNEEEIMSLYESVGWINYTTKPKILKKAYENSLLVLGAYKEKCLVGIVRVVGDGHSIIYIQDIIVLPEYQRNGIGSFMLKEIMNRYSFVYQKILMTEKEEKTIRFYESVGFTADYDMNLVAFGQFTVE